MNSKARKGKKVVTRQAKKSTMTMPEAMKLLSREERFMATVYAMNTLLSWKGIYSREEFEEQFVQSATNQIRRRENV